MAAHPPPIEITHLNNLNDLFHLLEEVNSTKQPRILKRDNETVAMLMPVETAITPKKKPAPTKADYAAFFSAFGSWNDVDTDALLNTIYATRKRSNRPPIAV